MRLETGDVYYDKMADTPVLPQHDGSKLIKQLLALNIDIGEDNEEGLNSNENRSRKSAISEAIGRPCSVLLHPNDHLFPDWEPPNQLKILHWKMGLLNTLTLIAMKALMPTEKCYPPKSCIQRQLGYISP